MSMKSLISSRTILACSAAACTAALAVTTLSAAQAGPAKPTANQGAATAKSIKLGDLEEHADRYVGQRISVSGEVQNVLGPRLFTIDEPNWIDLDGETVVLVPAPLAALVRRDNPVVVTGTVRPFVKTDIEREYGWFGAAPQLDIDVSKKYVLIADDVTTYGAHSLMEFSTRTAKPAAKSESDHAAVTDLSTLAKSNDTSLIGRRVDLKNAHVSGTSESGFWIGASADGDSILVMPANGDKTKIAQGQNVTVEGVVMELPKALRQKLGDSAKSEQTYVYADSISAAK